MIDEPYSWAWVSLSIQWACRSAAPPVPLDAGVGDELRRVEGPAEQPPRRSRRVPILGSGVSAYCPYTGGQDRDRSNNGCIRDTVSSILVKSTRPFEA